ncbi:XrtA system polysaccharide deacetylase [Rubripirellula obstinata]|uniref:XrtA system polysaccharide deacetylase n=1 Tax=Rubripirellula obstinata TaxID=406547 RepID=UPI0008315CEA|nr:XrtA system polysaccharide deacetylase [Rubripirellula obstinata]
MDVEDYFQVSAFERQVSRKRWDQYECRVETNTDRMLSLMDSCDIRGTFFVLGWVAHRFPKLVRRIARAGHEIASHGYWHQLVYDQTPEQFATDINDAQEAIVSACGVKPTAYRAPSFSITKKSLWALDILIEQGFTTDSSIFPIAGHDRYGVPDAKKEIHDRVADRGKLLEFPPSVAKVAGVTVPIGGGYFRLFPTAMTTAAIRRIQSSGRPAMFYIHPWEIDPDQPRIKGAGTKSRFRHYVNLKHTERKLIGLVQSHRFGTMATSIASANQAPLRKAG